MIHHHNFVCLQSFYFNMQITSNYSSCQFSLIWTNYLFVSGIRTDQWCIGSICIKDSPQKNAFTTKICLFCKAMNIFAERIFLVDAGPFSLFKNLQMLKNVKTDFIYKLWFASLYDKIFFRRNILFARLPSKSEILFLWMSYLMFYLLHAFFVAFCSWWLCPLFNP